MNACKTLVAATLALALALAPVAWAALPATIGQLSDMARARKIAEHSRATEPAARPGPPGGQQAAGGMPPGMTIVPSTAILANEHAPAAAAAKPGPGKAAPAPEVLPEIMAIVKAPNGMHYAELADAGTPARFVAGQVTTGGWTVTSIGARVVELARPATGDRPARRLTLALSNQ